MFISTDLRRLLLTVTESLKLDEWQHTRANMGRRGACYYGGDECESTHEYRAQRRPVKAGLLEYVVGAPDQFHSFITLCLSLPQSPLRAKLEHTVGKTYA
ncbi:hypothetical protein Ddc_01708 [Ditylenchus destructor]|nr:hypothetical protein Ddc_01708 [Ditylenchus destructor]